MGWVPKCRKERTVYLNETAIAVLKELPRLPSVGYVKDDPTPHGANFVFITRDRKRSTSGQAAWRRIDDGRESWKALLEAAGLCTPERIGAMQDSRTFTRHDLRRTFSQQGKQDGLMSVEEASQILGHNPQVNMDHYSGSGASRHLKDKMAKHPSNNQNLLQLVWSGLGTTVGTIAQNEGEITDSEEDSSSATA